MESITMLEKAPVASRSKLNESFAEAFQYALIKKFKQVPSAAWIANGFNTFTNYHHDINRETVRKWLTGKTIPEFDRLRILQDWLDMDLNGFGKSSQPKNESSHFSSDANQERNEQRYQYELEKLKAAFECFETFARSR